MYRYLRPCWVLLLSACGQTHHDGDQSASGAGNVGLGGQPATGGSTSGGASASLGGSSSGAPASSGGMTTEGGAPTSGGVAASGGVGLMACDPRKIACRRAAPTCPEHQVPSVESSCYGPCVPLEQCACDEAADCPNPESGTCHLSAKHCGPYVN